MNNQTLTVAISESHIIMRECLIQLLSKWGYQVILITSNGQDLINKLTQSIQPDICILDTHLSLMNELGACKLIKEKWPCIQILALTMNVIPALLRNLYGIADAVVCKADGILEIKSVLGQL